jgi:hypothetical protein
MDVAEVSSSAASTWADRGIRVRSRQSFLRFVMPLAFPDQEGHSGRFEQRCEKLAASGRWELLRGETQGLLPHVRMHLNSTMDHDLRSAGNGAANGVRALNPAVAFGYIFHHAEADGLPLPGSAFSFRIPGTERRVEVEITGAQLGVFRMGVGFVSLELKPTSDALPDWLDTLHFLRFYRGRGESLRLTGDGLDGAAGRLRLENLLGPLLAEATLDGEAPPFLTAAAGQGARHSGRVRELYVPGELLTDVALFVDGVPESEQRHLLYHVLHRFRSTSDSEPGQEYDLAPWCLPYREGQQFLNSIQGSAFIAFDSAQTPFNSQTLPAHLASTYFVLFMLALVQRFALDQLSEELAWSTGRVLGDPERSRAQRELERVTELDNRLLDFTGRCYFVQVSQMEHHHRYYEQLRDVYLLEDRYREVTEKVHALRAHASSIVSVEEERTALRVSTALMVITCVLLPLQVIEALFATKLSDLPGIRDLSPSWSAATAGFVLALAVGMVLLIIHGNRWRHRRG